MIARNVPRLNNVRNVVLYSMMMRGISNKTNSFIYPIKRNLMASMLLLHSALLHILIICCRLPSLPFQIVVANDQKSKRKLITLIHVANYYTHK